MRDALTWSALANPEIRSLAEPLRHDTRRFFLLVAVVGYVVWHTPHVVLVPAESTLRYWFLFAIVAVGLALATLLDRAGSRLATPALLLAGLVSVVAAVALLESPTPTLLLGPLTLGAVALLHPLAGIALIAGSAVVLSALMRMGHLPSLDEGRLVETIVASLLAAVAAWALGRNMIVASGWALVSYDQARRNTEEAQRHRGELVQALKQLDDAYWRLEQLNLELERARRSAHEARRLKEQFAMAVSHELRTPLNLILGFCEMMVIAPTSAYGHKLPATYRGDLEAMYRNASHLSELVDDILDLSQIDADRMALHREWVDLSAVAAEAISTVETLFLNRDLYVRSAVGAELPKLFVDGTRVRQILINLLGNAARFVQRGGVTVEAVCEDDAVVLSVRDTGTGIAAEDLPYVFEEFRQSSDPARRRGGSGLGLAVSKRFAELHGGDLTVESRPGEGTTFKLRLPLGDAALGVHRQSTPWEEKLASRVRGEARRRIAVLDDNGEVFNVFRRYCDDYDVLPAAEVEASVRQHRVEPIQAVVFGSADAPTRWRALCHDAPHLAALPQVTCRMRTSRMTAEEIGADDYLVKPVTRDQLRAALRRLGREVRLLLIVDDDPGMTRLLGRMVRSALHGCAVAIANDGESALRIARERRPDAIVLDLLMPDVDGYQVIQALRADDALRGIPVIVVSARGLHDETVVATHLAVARDEGLSVAEAMRWIRSGLAGMLEGDTSAPEPPAAPTA